jgi:hypothetical protein
MIPPTTDRSLPDPNTEPTISVPRAGRILGMSRNAAYAAARDGRLPTVPISPSRLVVVTAEFLEKYRLRRVPVPPPPQRPQPGAPRRPPTPTNPRATTTAAGTQRRAS